MFHNHLNYNIFGIWQNKISKKKFKRVSELTEKYGLDRANVKAFTLLTKFNIGGVKSNLYTYICNRIRTKSRKPSESIPRDKSTFKNFADNTLSPKP